MAFILGLTGEKLGGKDTAAEYLAAKYGAYHARHSHVLDDILKVLGLPISRRNEIDLAMTLRNTFGMGIVGQALQKRVTEIQMDYPLIVMNGVRFKEEVDYIRMIHGHLVYITAPEDVRYQRFLHRTEKIDDNTQSIEEFQMQEHEPTEINIPNLGMQADFKIENTGTLEQFYKKIDEIIKLLK